VEAPHSNNGRGERIVILGILNERGGACDGEWLRRDVQRLYPTRPVIYELAIEFLVKDGYIARRKSFFGDWYQTTEKGQVAALLTHGIYQEITKRRDERENTR
jgi:DNA-binding PadR family transcriptional regulator